MYNPAMHSTDIKKNPEYYFTQEHVNSTTYKDVCLAFCFQYLLYTTFIYSYNHHSSLLAATLPNAWGVSYIGYINTINEPTEYGN
jgi:hypothetical protein